MVMGTKQATNNPDLEARGEAEHSRGVIEKKVGQIKKVFRASHERLRLHIALRHTIGEAPAISLAFETRMNDGRAPVEVDCFTNVTRT